MTETAAIPIGPMVGNKTQDPAYVFPGSPDAAQTPAPTSPDPEVRVERSKTWRQVGRFALVALGLMAMFGAWHFWRGAGAPSSTAVAVATPVAKPTPVAVVPDAVASRLDAALADLKTNNQLLLTLVDGQKAQDAVLEKLQREVAGLTEGFHQLQERQAAVAAAAAARPRQRVAKVNPPSVPKSSAQLLSIDIWDGRPSAVVGTTDPADKRVVYLHEGDQAKGITLKQADPSRQAAVFDVAGRDVVMSRSAGQ